MCENLNGVGYVRASKTVGEVFVMISPEAVEAERKAGRYTVKDGKFYVRFTIDYETLRDVLDRRKDKADIEAKEVD